MAPCRRRTTYTKHLLSYIRLCYFAAHVLAFEGSEMERVRQNAGRSSSILAITGAVFLHQASAGYLCICMRKGVSFAMTILTVKLLQHQV